MEKKYISDSINQTVSSFKAFVQNGFLRKLDFKKLLLFILTVVALGGVSGSVYFYGKYKVLNANTDANAEAARETQRLIAVLGKLMELPQGEIPTIATISDKEKLKDQEFFTQADNGDILFAYTTSMKAILYRPSTNKIVNVAPISINQAPDVTQAVMKSDTASVNSN